jgi:SAM-dependent methyltransferase
LEISNDFTSEKKGQMLMQGSIPNYPFLPYRKKIWKQIALYVAKDSPGAERVLELGAGFCDFINQFPARNKTAFDTNPKMRGCCNPEVEFRAQSAVGLPGIKNESVDLIFASNFLEHLTADELDELLDRISEVLRPAGQLIILQPNHRLCANDYWADPTHKTIFSDSNLANIVQAHGLRVHKLIPGFLPFSLKSKLPKWAFLVKLYMASPIKPFAAQMYAVIRKNP